MVKQAAHDSSDECSNHSGLIVNIVFVTDTCIYKLIIVFLYICNSKMCIINILLRVRVLELVDRVNLSFIDQYRERSSRFSDKKNFFYLQYIANF